MNLIITSLLFLPEKDFYALPQDYGLKAQDLFVRTADGVRIHGWYFEAGPPRDPSRPRPTLLFFHGNGGNISGRLFKVPAWLERGVSVLLVDYRMYGKSDGKIHKPEDLLRDGEAALRWLEEEKRVPSERIILYGESIGSFPAVSLARGKKFAGLVLESPFTNLVELTRTHYPFVPPAVLGGFPMNNGEAIGQVQAPTFILHGTEDEICPFPMGERLYELAPSPKEFFKVEGGNHNDLTEIAGTQFIERPYGFISRHADLS